MLPCVAASSLQISPLAHLEYFSISLSVVTLACSCSVDRALRSFCRECPIQVDQTSVGGKLGSFPGRLRLIILEDDIYIFVVHYG